MNNPIKVATAATKKPDVEVNHGSPPQSPLRFAEELQPHIAHVGVQRAGPVLFQFAQLVGQRHNRLDFRLRLERLDFHRAL